jgi:predicted phosphoribosyltransferase
MFSRSSREPEFADRSAAGRALAERLASFAFRRDLVVLALPRGGVPVACEVAKALSAPLDVFVVRKLGVPGREELAMGAIASGDVVVVNDDVVNWYRLSPEDIEKVARIERAELERRERLYRDGRSLVPVADQAVVLVDDGLATGSTMKAAVRAVRGLNPSRIVVAVPVGAPSTCRELRALADDVVCVAMPESFSAVGQFYSDFSQTTDDEVRRLLAACGTRRA